MIKFKRQEFIVGTNFQLRNSWRKSVITEIGITDDSYPFNFRIMDIDNDIYICESIPDKKTDKTYRIIVSEHTLKYIFGEEVDDCNVGLYFSDYFPLENTKILIYDNKDDYNVLPVEVKLIAEIIDDNTVKLSFKLQSLILNKSYSVKSQMKNSWKFLFSSDKYMNDIERMYQDTFIHKAYIVAIAARFAEYLNENGSSDDAEKLLHRAKNHDNSKILNKDEFRALTHIINDKKALKDASKSLSSYKQDAIELHWKNNDHHPEHYEAVCEMTRAAKQEMCCDWCARSLQYGTDLIDFVEKRQEDRFRFPEQFYKEVLQYCKILVDITKDIKLS